jgi:hypothetical protein
MTCIYCGRNNADALRYCAGCAAALGAAPTRPPAWPLPAPVQAAVAGAAPVPRSPRTDHNRARALVAGVKGLPAAVVPAALPGPRQRAAEHSVRSTVAGPDHPAVAHALGWGCGGLLLCVALLLGTQEALRRVPGTQPGSLLTSRGNAAQEVGQSSPPAPATAPEPAPEPVPEAALPTPSSPEAEPRAEVAPARPMPPVVRDAPTVPPVPPVPPTAPDAGAIARTVQRELARLGLNDVSVEVDATTLQLTLRGTTHSAERKAQALAAARAANLAGRVRDLVFLVDE